MKTENLIALTTSVTIIAVFALMTNCSIQVSRTEADQLCRKQGGLWDGAIAKCIGDKP